MPNVFRKVAMYPVMKVSNRLLCVALMVLCITARNYVSKIAQQQRIGCLMPVEVGVIAEPRLAAHDAFLVFKVFGGAVHEIVQQGWQPALADGTLLARAVIATLRAGEFAASVKQVPHDLLQMVMLMLNAV